MTRFTVLERSAEALRPVTRRYENSGWSVVDEDEATGRPGQRAAVTMTIETPEDARRGLLKALDGWGLIVLTSADRSVIDPFLDDLRRLGAVNHLIDHHPPGPVLTPDEEALLEALASGATLGVAAANLHISRRTADRRMARIREALGVDTTAAALVAYRRLRGEA